MLAKKKQNLSINTKLMKRVGKNFADNKIHTKCKKKEKSWKIKFYFSIQNMHFMVNNTYKNVYLVWLNVCTSKREK